jgi:hypothetical protein
MRFNTRTEVDAFLKAHGLFLPVTAGDGERNAETSRQFRDRLSS